MLAPSSNELTRRAGELLRKPVVRRSDLELVFDESSATTAEVHVEGRNFYPPMLHDIASARTSVHINQFGFRPGTIGEAFAEALLAKASPIVPGLNPNWLMWTEVRADAMSWSIGG